MSSRTSQSGSAVPVPGASLAAAHSQFSVQAEPPRRQLLAWRERVAHVIDVLPTRQQVEQPFAASISSVRLGEMMFTDCRSDALTLERSLARISTDNIRNYAFHLFLEGGASLTGGTTAEGAQRPGGISLLALDMDQPVRMQRDACHMLTLFAPRTMVDALLPDAAAIHGRVCDSSSTQLGLLSGHMQALNRELPHMRAPDAAQSMQTALQLIMAAFGKQTGLQGNARAAQRAAMLGRVRRYIQQHLHQQALTPDLIVHALQLPRRTLYRLFEHEGGLETYIRNCKLRAAADDLVNFPRLSVLEVAYGLGFKSAAHFTRAFRRRHDMTPQDFRAQVLLRRAGLG